MENETVRKEVFTLLELNYVEDDDNMFRCEACWLWGDTLPNYQSPL